MTLGLIAGWKKWLGRTQGTLPAHSGLSIWCLWPRRKWSHKKAVPEASDAQPEPILESPDSPHEGHPNPEGLQSLSSSLMPDSGLSKVDTGATALQERRERLATSWDRPTLFEAECTCHGSGRDGRTQDLPIELRSQPGWKVGAEL